MRKLARGAWSILVCLAGLALVWGPGCASAGDAARVELAKTVAAEWVSVKNDAEVGVRAHEDPEVSAKLGISHVSPEVAKIMRSHQAVFDEAVKKLAERPQ